MIAGYSALDQTGDIVAFAGQSLSGCFAERLGVYLSGP